MNVNFSTTDNIIIKTIVTLLDWNHFMCYPGVLYIEQQFGTKRNKADGSYLNSRSKWFTGC